MRRRFNFSRWAKICAAVAALWFIVVQTGSAMAPNGSIQYMHIMEGFLSPFWCIFWYVVSLPFWILGFLKLKKVLQEKPETRLLMGMSGAFIFVLSALKMPSVTGSSSHPTGTGLGAVLFGPRVVTILGTIVLVFQALLLAHGGITTLGANSFSMAIVGPYVAMGVWLLLKNRTPNWLAVFVTAVVADWVTYVVTAVELSMAYPDPSGGFMASFLKFAGIYAVTQIPLAISEGLLTVLIMNALRSNAPSELKSLGLMGLKGEKAL